ncbi:MAG: ParB/RepB/Spo0J family partition protein, partial [Deltaproteobacteria bacterium]|nr:ParB/RepB/Spo0J family partition protein [Deltaproteobacteria bacterium]
LNGDTLPSYFLCPVGFIIPNPYQPRKNFAQEELAGLSASIKEKGILQPLVVRRLAKNKYELIAGERRLRAAKQAELEKVPVLVKDISISDRLELALIENIQRENLNPLDEAVAYAQLVDEFGLTQDSIAKRVGKSRSAVANNIRILQLPEFAKESLGKGDISAGHARVLLSLEKQEDIRSLHDIMVTRKISVRESESIARDIKNILFKRAKSDKKTPITALPTTYCQNVAKNLHALLGARSRIKQNGSKGKIEITYTSPEDLERIMKLMVGG